MMNKKKRSAFDTGVWLLNYKMRSKKDLYDMLIKKEYSHEEVSEAIYQLEDYGYIDDDKYKEYLIGQKKHNNVKGREFIRWELSRSGITDLDDLEDLYSNDEEIALIKKLLLQWGYDSDSSHKEKNRFIGRLSRRGFAIGNIFQAMSINEE